jgi:hypothetical protein
MNMVIFRKENGTPRSSNVPLKSKKFFNMSKSTEINLVLQRNGEKYCHLIIYQLIMKFFISLG